jgi:HD-GYP domain-containing protein (c-di-GMP phosphodiesterase class II)
LSPAQNLGPTLPPAQNLWAGFGAGDLTLRSLPVSTRELARWTGLDAVALEQLALSGKIPSHREEAGYSFDPRRLQETLSSTTPSRTSNGSNDLNVLDRLALVSASEESVEDFGRRVLERYAEVFSATHGTIFLADGDAWLRPAARWGAGEIDDWEALDGIAAWVAISGDPLLLPSLHDEPAAGPDADLRLADPSQITDREALAAPLQLGDQRVGVVMLGRDRGGPRFTDRDLSLLSTSSTQLALAIDRMTSRHHLATRERAADLVQSQLEAYAHDFRETFAAEKRRSQELSDALDELERTYFATVRGLAVAVEAKDEYTAGHLIRVTRLGMAMLRIVDDEEAKDPQYKFAFLLHDIGKLAVPDAVLGKSGPLNETEWEIMRSHSVTGRRILEDIPFLSGAKEIVFAHHERWDGKGYPRGLRGEAIPAGARVFSVADSFDAMTSNRPYRRAMPLDDALSEIERGSGTQFWPLGVEALLGIPKPNLEAMMEHQ